MESPVDLQRAIQDLDVEMKEIKKIVNDHNREIEKAQKVCGLGARTLGVSVFLSPLCFFFFFLSFFFFTRSFDVDAFEKAAACICVHFLFGRVTDLCFPARCPVCSWPTGRAHPR